MAAQDAFMHKVEPTLSGVGDVQVSGAEWESRKYFLAHACCFAADGLLSYVRRQRG